MSYLLSLIIIISLYSHEAISDPVDIANSDYKLSTDVTYAIYNVDTSKYLCYTEDLIYHLGFESKPEDGVYQWKIEKQEWNRYALKNVVDNSYFGYTGPGLVPSAHAWSTWILGWTFNRRVTTENIPGVPTIEIWGNARHLGGDFSVQSSYVYHIPGLPQGGVPHVPVFCANGKTISPFQGSCPYKSKFVFIPATLPPNCENITFTPAKPEQFQELTVQLEQSYSITHKNIGSTPSPYTTPEVKKCNKITTTFSRTAGSEKSYGFGVEFDYTGGGGFNAGVVQANVELHIAADYHMDWKTSEETTDTTEDEEEHCVNWPATSLECPPRTTCKRLVLIYKPVTKQVDTTVTAICDGNKYITYGKTSINGVVGMAQETTETPMDCKYYTTDYNIFKPGTLQFCDTCNNDQRCEICRDGYVLLDGVCVTQATCEAICGGDVQGGNRDDGNSAPWSDGFCQITNPSKFTSNECQQQLGKK